MPTQRRLILIGLVVAFAAVAGVLIWNFFFTATQEFPAGTQPALTTAKTDQPTMPTVKSGEESRGSSDKNAAVIVEYADFSSRASRVAELSVRQALSESARPFRVIWRDFPLLDAGIQAVTSAMAARCASEQGKFWPMHDVLLQAAILDIPSIEALAQQLGLSTDQFNQCLEHGKYLTTVENSAAEAVKNRVSVSPTFFIGKTVLTGAITAEQLESAIRRAP